eukprot:scaffold92902_cov66-Phaeocystis_antarctica.AAC.4
MLILGRASNMAGYVSESSAKCSRRACLTPAEGAAKIHLHWSARRIDELVRRVQVRTEAVKVHGVVTAHGVPPAALGCAPFRPVARLADKALGTKAGAFLLLLSSLVSQAALLVASQTR